MGPELELRVANLFFDNKHLFESDFGVRAVNEGADSGFKILAVIPDYWQAVGTLEHEVHCQGIYC